MVGARLQLRAQQLRSSLKRSTSLRALALPSETHRGLSIISGYRRGHSNSYMVPFMNFPHFENGNLGQLPDDTETLQYMFSKRQKPISGLESLTGAHPSNQTVRFTDTQTNIPKGPSTNETCALGFYMGNHFYDLDHRAPWSVWNV